MHISRKSSIFAVEMNKITILEVICKTFFTFAKGAQFLKGDHLTQRKSYYAKLSDGSKRAMTRDEILAPFPGRKRITSNLLDWWKGKTID